MKIRAAPFDVTRREFKRALAAATVLAAGWMTPVLAEQGRNPDRQQCSDIQDSDARERCEHPWSRVEQNFSVLTGPTVCGKDRDGCRGGDVHNSRPPRPPYWIGHHYSGL
jgi:hypothetical protein